MDLMKHFWDLILCAALAAAAASSSMYCFSVYWVERTSSNTEETVCVYIILQQQLNDKFSIKINVYLFVEQNETKRKNMAAD